MDFRWRVGATTSAQMAFSKATERKPKLAGLINWRARGARAYNGGQRTNPPAGPGAARVPNKRFRDASEASSLLTLRCPKEGQIVYNKKIIYRKQHSSASQKYIVPRAPPAGSGKVTYTVSVGLRIIWRRWCSPHASCRGMVDRTNTHLPFCITAGAEFNSFWLKGKTVRRSPESENPSPLAWDHPHTS